MHYDLATTIIHGVVAVMAIAGWYEARQAKKHAVELKVEVNHRLTELLLEKGKASRAEGKAEGKAEGPG